MGADPEKLAVSDNVFATAAMHGSHQVLAQFQGEVEINRWRVQVRSYDRAKGVHLDVNMDFPTEDKAWTFFNSFKTDADVRAKLGAVLVKALAEVEAPTDAPY